MSLSLVLSGYDLTDEGPGRTVNEDATLVRQDLGLYAVADGAGGRGKGDVAATLALRTMENYVGSTVRSSHARPDFDLLGNPEQARRLSAAIHQAHLNIQEVIAEDTKRTGMACTVVAALFAPRTNQIHVAHVGDSRCYRMRHGRLELLTVDDTIATEILQSRPETPDEVLEKLPRNSVVRAVGMSEGFRVAVTSHDLIPGDRFLLCTDGLTRFVETADLWEAMREPDPPSVLASELLSLALAARGQDNISVLVIDCQEEQIDDSVETQRYNEFASMPPSAPRVAVSEAPNSGEFQGPEVVSASVFEAIEDFRSDSDVPTNALPRKELSGMFEAGLVADLPPAFETSDEPSAPFSVPEPKTYDINMDDIEFDNESLVDVEEPLSSAMLEELFAEDSDAEDDDTSQVRQAPSEPPKE